MQIYEACTLKSQLPLEELIRQYQLGATEHFDDIFYHLRYNLVMQLKYHKTKFTIEELAQCGRIALFYALKDYRPGHGDFTRWLYWKVQTEIRKEKHLLRLGLATSKEIADHVPRLDIQLDMQEILKLYTKEEIDLLLLRKFKQQAEKEGVTKQAIWGRKQKLINMLRQQLTRAGYGTA